VQDHKCLRAVVMVCAILVNPKLDFYTLTPVTFKNRSNEVNLSVGAPTRQIYRPVT